MGTLVDVEWYRQPDILAVYIPHAALPRKWHSPEVKIEELEESRTYETTTYIYGGRAPPKDATISEAIKMLKNRQYRVGVRGRSDWVKEYGMPTDLALVSVYDPKQKKWIKITEQPKLTVRRWGASYRWRSQIPMKIADKYNMYATPTGAEKRSMRVKVRYTSFVPKQYITRYLNVRHMYTVYKTRWNNNRKQWLLIVPRDTASYQQMIEGMTFPLAPITPIAECYYNKEKDYVEIDFIIPGADGKAVSRATDLAFRNMHVNNYSLTEIDTLDYPFNVEIRATFISCSPRLWRQDEEYRSTVITALKATVANMQSRFLPPLQSAIKKGVKKGGEIDVTEGEEKNKNISYGETEGFEYDYCIKYIRIRNESKPKEGWEYHTKRIEKDLAVKDNLKIDKHGFIWYTGMD
ncbi:MAG: hypothetical protein ACOC5T_05240 [Elusimicrobiota bacterium]